MQTTVNQTGNASGQQTSVQTDQTTARARRLRIIHVVSSLKVGGMEQMVLRLAEAQQAAGHTVTILALHGGPLEQAAAQLQISVHILGGRHKIPRVLRGLLVFARLHADIVHAHNQTSLHYAVLGKRVSGAHVIMTNHGQGSGNPRTQGAKEWKATDAVVTVSRAVEARMSTTLESKLSTIYNGVREIPPGRSRRQIREELHVAETRVVGCIVARMDGLKGHDTLLQALAHLENERIPVTLLMIGDGKERANLERLAGELKLESDSVRFLGFRTDIADLLAASDFFVLPSLTEGLPLSILEAMTYSLPTVATPVGGIPELIEHNRHGLLVPVQDAEALAAAIARLARQPELRCAMGVEALQRVRNEFSFTRMTSKYEGIYYSL